MTKFKNKKTKKIVEVNLLYYVNQLRNNSDYAEIKGKEDKTSSKNGEENKNSSEDNKEVEN